VGLSAYSIAGAPSCSSLADVMGKSSHSFSPHPNNCRRLDLATSTSRRSGPDKSMQRGHYGPSRPGMEQSVVVSTMGSQSTPHLGFWTHQSRTLRWSRQSLSSRNPALRVDVSGTCGSSQSYAHMSVLALISSPAAASCCHVSCPAPSPPAVLPSSLERDPGYMLAPSFVFTSTSMETLLAG
jgi:hypothetical protein